MVIYHPKTEHKYTLIWLHGLGDSAFGIRDLFLSDNFINLPEGCKVILPSGPIKKIGILNDMPMRAWYDIKFESKSSDSTSHSYDSVMFNQDEITQSANAVL